MIYPVPSYSKVTVHQLSNHTAAKPCPSHLSPVSPLNFTHNHFTKKKRGLVRFIAKSTGNIAIGKPASQTIDVGAAILAGKAVSVETYSGASVLSPGSPTGKTEEIGRLLSPLAESEVGTIRCIGLNVSPSGF
jgi:hypothetical protein